MQQPENRNTGKNVYFISDLHLGATYLQHPRKYENRVVNLNQLPTTQQSYI
jgi:hypothetical protein